MNNTCEIVRDLLPLYVDSVCSDASRALVEEHIAGCRDCMRSLSQMKNQELELGLAGEKSGVIERQSGFFRRRSAAVGTVIAGIFMIPVIVCLIVNLASSAALDWFFIVLASLLTAASLTVVPLMAADNRGLWTLGTFTASLLLLLGVCCLYSGGNWFFVASSAVLFGLSVIFMPFVVRTKPARRILGNHKALAVFVCDTVLFVLMLVSIGMRNKSPDYAVICAAVAGTLTAFVWLIFLIIRYLKANGLVKAGICCALAGTFLFSVNNIINALMGSRIPWPKFSPFIWNGYTMDGNIKWLLLITGCAVGIIMTAFGIMKAGKDRK